MKRVPGEVFVKRNVTDRQPDFGRLPWFPSQLQTLLVYSNDEFDA